MFTNREHAPWMPVRSSSGPYPANKALPVFRFKYSLASQSYDFMPIMLTHRKLVSSNRKGKQCIYMLRVGKGQGVESRAKEQLSQSRGSCVAFGAP